MRNLLSIIALIILIGSCQNDRRAIVVSKIRQASLLATTEFTIDKTVFATREKKLLGLFKINQADFLAYTTAIVKAGIDLDRLGAEDIRIEGKRISLRLPHVEVINFSYPVEKYRIDHDVTNDAFLNRFTIEDYDRFFQQAEIDIRNNLKYLGIIKTTKQKTRILIETLLKNLGYREIYISFDDGPLIPEISTETENQGGS